MVRGAVADKVNRESAPLRLTIFLAIALALVCVWALSLRSENERLRARLAAHAGPTVAQHDAAPPPIPTPPPTAPDPRPAPTGPNRLSDDDRAAMRGKLPATAPPGSRVWFAVSFDPEAQALAGDLQQVFQQAGWQVLTSPANFSVRAGIFFFAADDSPPTAVEDVLKALQVVGYVPTVGLGYRAFAEERRRADPNWRGVELAPDQSFVIVIGPR